MLLTYRNSVDCTKSELDLFTLLPVQSSIEKGQWVEYHPISNVRDGGPVEFKVSGNGDEYLDLSKTLLHVKAKIVKSDGTAIPASAKVGPVNLFLQSMFQQVNISLNEQLVTSASNTYPYRALIEKLLNYHDHTLNSQMACEMFFFDTPGKMDNPDPYSDQPNEGLKKRAMLTKESHVIDLLGFLHADLFFQGRLLLNMVDVHIKLIRSKDSFCLICNDGEEGYRVVIEASSLYVRKVKVSAGVVLGHAKALEKGNARYPIDRVLCKTYAIPQGNMSFVQDNVFLGQMPKRVILAMVDNASFNGVYNLNPFHFKHYKANFVCLYVDGQPVPHKALEPNFETGSYTRSYHSLFLGTEAAGQDKGLAIDREGYSQGYTLFAFDLSPDLCEAGHFNLIRQGNLRLELKFAAALPSTITVIVYAEFENVVEITKTRHILTDFTQ